MSFLAGACMDMVLALGPFYHLWELRDRRAAAAEAARVLKPGGLLFAAAVNRLTYLRDMFRKLEIPGIDPALVDQVQGRFRRELREGRFPAEYLASGRVDPEHAPPIGYAHLTTVAEFRQLFARDFAEAQLVGLESFTSAALAPFAGVAAEDRERWLDLVEQTNATAEGLGYSDHFLFIGSRRAAVPDSHAQRGGSTP